MCTTRVAPASGSASSRNFRDQLTARRCACNRASVLLPNGDGLEARGPHDNLTVSACFCCKRTPASRTIV